MNVDLILGGAGETDADVVATVEAVLSMDPPPEHVSAYGLTVEPGTPLARDPARHPDEDAVGRRYELVADAARCRRIRVVRDLQLGRPGHACRHNELYWAQGDYRGIGAAAHSHPGAEGGGTCAPPSVTSTPSRPGGAPPPATRHSTTSNRPSSASPSPCARRRECPPSALPDDPDLDGLVKVHDGPGRAQSRGRLLANEVTVRLRVTSSLVA